MIRGTTAIEDYHAHLLRLDRASCFPGDDRGVDAHCLDLLASGAILIGAYVKGVMRASAEIVPDRTARRAEAAITVEEGFHEINAWLVQRKVLPEVDLRPYIRRSSNSACSPHTACSDSVIVSAKFSRGGWMK